MAWHWDNALNYFDLSPKSKALLDPTYLRYLKCERQLTPVSGQC